MTLALSTFQVQPTTSLTGTLTLRLWYSIPFLDVNDIPVLAGPKDFYVSFDCSIASGVITVSEGEIFSTLDANIQYPQSIRVSAQFYKGNAAKEWLFANWVIPSEAEYPGGAITFAQLSIYNDGSNTLANPSQNYLTREQTIAYFNTLDPAPDASTSIKGIGKVSVAPVSATIPIFVGDNDTRVTAALADPGANGLVVRTAANVSTARTLTGTANQVTVTNGSGVSGNPTLSIPASAQLSVAKLTNLTSNGFVKTGSADGSLSVDIASYTPTTRTLTEGAGLAGNVYDLSANRSLAMGTPTTLTASSSNSASGTTHSHAITSSSAPGAAARILASDSSGSLTLPDFLATHSVQVTGNTGFQAKNAAGSPLNIYTLTASGGITQSRLEGIPASGNFKISINAMSGSDLAYTTFAVKAAASGTGDFRFSGDSGIAGVTIGADSTPTAMLDVRGAVASTGAVLSSSSSGGIGYATGAGGSVTQLTSKSTSVTLNKICGSIGVNGAALAAGARVTFAVSNSTVGVNDVIRIMHNSGGTFGAYVFTPNTAGAGVFDLTITNISAGSLSEALGLKFVVIKSVET